MRRILHGLALACAGLWSTTAFGQELAGAIAEDSIATPPLHRTPDAATLGQEIVVSFGGDVNFARSRQNPLPDRVVKFGTLPLARFTETLAAEWSGDINFVNVETVVSARNGALQGKTFVFRSHPDQFRHLMDLGVNAFALANNHAYDHGRIGMRDTLAFFEAEDRAARPLLYAGVGVGQAAFTPKIIRHGDLRIAMGSASFGSGSFAPSATQIGMAYTTVPPHYQAVLDGLRDADADLKILSLHSGFENITSLDFGQQAFFRRAVEEAGVHLVIGHHPHVVRAVEHDADRGAAIFYSLGNLLFIGGAAKDGDSLGRDYGLLGRAYFTQTAQGMRLTALEAVPLKGVHHIPRHPPASRARATIGHLNRLSQSSVGASGVEFDVVGGTRPRGLACFAETPFGPRAQALCCEADATHAACAFPDLM